MQPRLMRSRTESIFAGVCGGLGDYFGVDPVIVRLIFVLVTLTTGLGLLIYPVLWLSMPRAPERQSYNPAGMPQLDAQEQMAMGVQAAPYVMQEARARSQASSARSSAVPPPEAYKFDPLTGQPIQRDPTTGATTMLNDSFFDQNALGPVGPAAPAPRSRAKRWSIVGVVLLGVGLMALADAIGINTDIVFPILMIIGGLALLRRR
ncbi:MAG: PspC domain-containing protein [Roseiflexaceae bacterium]